jgi:hypothetical protein
MISYICHPCIITVQSILPSLILSLFPSPPVHHYHHPSYSTAGPFLSIIGTIPFIPSLLPSLTSYHYHTLTCYLLTFCLAAILHHSLSIIATIVTRSIIAFVLLFPTFCMSHVPSLLTSLPFLHCYHCHTFHHCIRPSLSIFCHLSPSIIANIPTFPSLLPAVILSHHCYGPPPLPFHRRLTYHYTSHIYPHCLPSLEYHSYPPPLPFQSHPSRLYFYFGSVVGGRPLLTCANFVPREKLSRWLSNGGYANISLLVLTAICQVNKICKLGREAIYTFNGINTVFTGSNHNLIRPGSRETVSYLGPVRYSTSN